MSKIDAEERVGIFLKKNDFQLAEIEKSASSQFRINRLIQARIETKFDLISLQKENQIIEIANQIVEIIRAYKADAKNVVFAIESPLAMVKKFPLDANLTAEELINQVNWEVRQFSFSSDDKYIVDFQQVDSSNGKPSKEVIVVSVREKIIQQLKKLFSTAKISVHVIELDIFAAIRAIKNNYDLTGDKLVALIEIDEIGIQVTIVKDQNFFLSQEISSSKLGLENKSLKEIDEVGQARLIAREMRRIVQDHQLGESVESINRIFLYGNVVKDGLVENLQNTYNVRIDKTNPFRNLFIGPKASTDDKISSHPEAFTVCIGSALR